MHTIHCIQSYLMNEVKIHLRIGSEHINWVKDRIHVIGYQLDIVVVGRRAIAEDLVGLYVVFT